MKILHISDLNNYIFNGIVIVLPQHIYAQSQFAQVGYMNISNVKLVDGDYQINFNQNSWIDDAIKKLGGLDLVVFHDVYCVSFLKIYKQLIKRGIPYIIIPHGCLSHQAQKKKHLKKIVANFLLFNNFINNAIAIQCLSEFEMNNTHFGKESFIGTNGVNIPKLSKKCFSKEGIKFLYIGRLDVLHKGLDIMIGAVANTADIFRKTKSTLSLFGPDLVGRFNRVKKLINHYNVSDIVFLDHEVVGEKKESLILGADIFIQTSRFEGMPMGILEAMSYGLPCLVTKGTTLESLISDNKAGWGADTTIEAVSQAIMTSFDQRNDLIKKSVNSRNLVFENFSWKTIAHNTIAQYQTLLSNIKISKNIKF